MNTAKCYHSHPPLFPFQTWFSHKLQTMSGKRGNSFHFTGVVLKAYVDLTASPSSGRPVQIPAGAAGRWVTTHSCPPLSNPGAHRQHMINNKQETPNKQNTSDHCIMTFSTHTQAKQTAVHSLCPGWRNWAGIRMTRSPPGPYLWTVKDKAWTICKFRFAHPHS